MGYQIKTNLKVNKPELNMKNIKGIMTISNGVCRTIYNNPTFTKMVFSSMKRSKQNCSLIRTTHDNLVILEVYNNFNDEQIKDKTIQDIKNMKEEDKGLRELSIEVNEIQ
jgi:hypothetical protein